MFKATPFSIIIFFAFAINAVTFTISWRRKDSKSGLYFALGMLGLAIWSLGAALDYAAISLDVKIFFAKIEAIGYLSAVPLIARSIISFAGNDHWLKKKWFKGALILIPLISILIVCTNEWHGWMWAGFEPQANHIFVFRRGPAYEWMIAVYYLLLAFIFMNLWMAFRKGSDLTRKQARLMMFAALFPLASNLVYQAGFRNIKGVDWTSITFSITGTIMLYAFYGMRFLDIIPIARDKLFNSLSDGMIVLDRQNRIVDINDIAKNLLPSSAIGQDLTQIDLLPPSILEYPLEKEGRTEIVIGEVEKQYFDVLVSPLYDERKENIGRLFMFRNVTELKQANLASAQRVTEIQKLHQELQESQAQLVEQQRVMATMEERQRMGRDLHDSVNQSIHSLMLFSETLTAMLEKNDTERATQISRRLQESARQALKETRLLLYQTRTGELERGEDFIRQLELRLAAVERHAGVKARIIQEGSLDNCPKEWYENLFWITVEALNNSLKHAQAYHIRIIFRCSARQIELEIADDGKGFDAHTPHSGGFGLQSMRERAALLGGTLTFSSSPGKGTSVLFQALVAREL
ncbi:MAG: histidine kinase N-terminal 7TM domain-containing protein [Anaerolineales bacterium]|nr:histidine kinase N-terminal 7TM domain-containing protein [Anaerolineales bacterium]